MNILIVGTRADQRDGWGKYCSMLRMALSQRANIETKLAISNLSSKTDLENSDFQIRSNRRLNVRRRDLIVDLIRNWHRWRAADIIVAADELSAPVCAFAAILFKKRLMLVIHGTYAIRCLDCKKSKLYRQAFSAAASIISVSNYTKARLSARLPQISEKIHVVPLAALSSPISRPTQQLAENHFCVVGGLKPRKGVMSAIKSLEILIRKGQDVRLVVVGEQSHNDSYVKKVMDYVANADISDHITFSGFVSEKEKNHIVATSIANLLPSENVGDAFEGFGFVHLEAGLLAVPTIGSLNCGNEDAIRNGKTGFLLEQGDVQGLAKRMDDFVTDNELRNRIGLLAQDFVFDWTWQDIASEFERLATIDGK